MRQNVTIDGEPWRSTCYVEWDAFERGARIELVLTDRADVACGALPPSLSTGGFA